MAGDFYSRLRDYYLQVAKVLRGEAEAGAIFPNPTDVGQAREKVYAEFLRQHAPSKCNVFLGGFLFDEDGNESRQMDVIVTTDTAPRFNFHNSDGSGKSFSTLEGTLGVASIKSTLDKKQLYEALDGMASIPPMASIAGRIPQTFSIPNYSEWPYKIIYASNGIHGNTIFAHLNAYYKEHREIPISRRPDVIHVAGKYTIFQIREGATVMDASTGIETTLSGVAGSFLYSEYSPDVTAIAWVLDDLQLRAVASTHILFKYGGIRKKVLETI